MTRIKYLEIVPNERLVFDHGGDIDDDPKRFRVTITFDDQADKKTLVTLSMKVAVTARSMQPRSGRILRQRSQRACEAGAAPTSNASRPAPPPAERPATACPWTAPARGNTSRPVPARGWRSSCHPRVVVQPSKLLR